MNARRGEGAATGRAWLTLSVLLAVLLPLPVLTCFACNVSDTMLMVLLVAVLVLLVLSTELATTQTRTRQHHHLSSKISFLTHTGTHLCLRGCHANDVGFAAEFQQLSHETLRHKPHELKM